MMTIAPLLTAASPIPSHAIAAFFALVLGAVQLYLPKYRARHRWLGRVWAALIAYVAVSSFFISEINMFWGFSLIHLLSIFTLVMLIYAVWMARLQKINAHKRAMKALYFYSLIIAGAFTFVPGRIMYEVFLR